MIRLLILRTMVIIGAPGAALLCWLARPGTWRTDFRAEAVHMWNGNLG